jgi:hypothetical protein
VRGTYNFKILFFVVSFFFIGSHKGKKPLLLYPTKKKTTLPLYPPMEENLFHCIPQQEKSSSVVSHSGRKSPPL